MNGNIKKHFKAGLLMVCLSAWVQQGLTQQTSDTDLSLPQSVGIEPTAISESDYGESYENRLLVLDPKSFDKESQLSCLLEPSSEIRLSSQVAGVVSAVNAERGGQVKKGQVLVSLESDLERAALNTVKARAEFAKRKLQRNRDLLAQGMLSDFERDELVTDEQLARLAVDESIARLKQRNVRSPITGVVVKRHVSIGEYVGTDPIMELVALNPLNAEVVMRADQYGQIEEGMQVMVQVQDPSNPEADKTVQGKVTVVDRVIDAASSTFGFRVEVPNPSLSLPAGLKCRIEF